MKTLLTGATGFLGGHVLNTLLRRGHSVVATVRSEEKGRQIRASHSDFSQEKLDYVVVPDIAAPGAFSKMELHGLEAVVHVASPFHYNTTDVKKDLIDPAVLGTTGVLRSVKESYPGVTRVVITSSFAAILNMGNVMSGTKKTYSEADWSPVTLEDGLANANVAYVASKALAEKAAWDFIDTEKPNFTLSTINPPMIYGPVKYHVKSLDSVNTSNQFLADVLSGKYKSGLPPTGFPLWVDVRDVALAHVLAMEKEEAAGKRFLITAGFYKNADLVQTVWNNFPELREKLPEEENWGLSEKPNLEPWGYDNSRAEKILGIQWTPYEKTVVDSVSSLIKQ
ncbi:ketoreductase [Diaporthe sp. PMI_573]|nr:ketoreductase [Diaporthaceae sp. PMI_573]